MDDASTFYWNTAWYLLTMILAYIQSPPPIPPVKLCNSIENLVIDHDYKILVCCKMPAYEWNLLTHWHRGWKRSRILEAETEGGGGEEKNMYCRKVTNQWTRWIEYNGALSFGVMQPDYRYSLTTTHIYHISSRSIYYYLQGAPTRLRAFQC